MKNKTQFYRSTRHSLFARGMHGTFVFGTLFTTLLLSGNYYFTKGVKVNAEFEILRTGALARGSSGCSQPYAIVEFEGIKKQLVFQCHEKFDNAKSVIVLLQSGLFGFMTIRDMKIEQSTLDQNETNSKILLLKEYDTLLIKAEEYYSEGNIIKSLELYERAITFKPNDEFARTRLDEIRKSINSNQD